MLSKILFKFTLVGEEWVLWVLVGMSLLSVSLVIERIIYLYNHRVNGKTFGEQLKNYLESGDLPAAKNLASSTDSIEGRVVLAGLESMHRGHTACAEVMQGVKAQIKPEVDSRLTMIASVGSNAPFVGLLGTVLGIVKAASDISESQNPQAAMAGVFASLVATAAGLVVAIPAVVAYNLLGRQVKKTLGQVDALMHLVLSFAKEH